MLKKCIGIGEVVGVLILSVGIVRAADVSTSLDIVSAYVFRGTTLSDSLVAQPSIEISTPVTFGVWGNMNSDEYGADNSGQFTEVDLYASYALPLELKPLGISIGYTEYLYPSQSGADADREANISLSADVLLSPTFTTYYGLDGAVDKAFYLELGLSHALQITQEVGCNFDGTVGYSVPDSGKSGFSDAKLGATLNYGIFSVGVTYVAQLDSDVLPDAAYDAKGVPTSLGYDEKFIFSAGISKKF